MAPLAPFRRVSTGLLTMSSGYVAKLLLRAFLWVMLLRDVTASSNETAEKPGFEVGTLTGQQQSPTCWIFSHLQKSGGSSIKAILKMGGCRTCIKVNYDVQNWCGEKATPDRSGDEHHDKLVLMGGYTEALRGDPTFKDCVWLTIFRHPIPRLVSAFFYCKIKARDPCCGANKMPAEARDNITAFAKHWGNFAVRQFALGLIPAEDVLDYIHETEGTTYDCIKDSGWYALKLYLEGKSTYPGSITHEDGALYGMLQRIKNVVAEKFTAVGILEEFNTTISLFETALPIPGVNWQRGFLRFGVQNEDNDYKDKEKQVLAEAWANSELKSYLELDIMLYEHAVDVFHKQVQFYGVE